LFGVRGTSFAFGCIVGCGFRLHFLKCGHVLAGGMDWINILLCNVYSGRVYLVYFTKFTFFCFMSGQLKRQSAFHTSTAGCIPTSLDHHARERRLCVDSGRLMIFDLREHKRPLGGKLSCFQILEVGKSGSNAGESCQNAWSG
jgi:hypothetical protein